MKKTLLIVPTLALVLACGTWQPLSAKSIFTLFGAFDLMQKEGSNSDYLEGERDFCLTDGHTLTGFGFGIKSEKPFYIGFELQYTLKGTAVQTDPSDNDTVTIDTYPRASGSLLLGVRVVDTPTIAVAIEAGGGGVYLMSTDPKTYISTAGYETIIATPENTFGGQAFGGLAVTAFFSKAFGLNIGARYQIFFLKPQQNTIALQAGLAIRI
jgi:hypothetical protein